MRRALCPSNVLEASSGGGGHYGGGIHLQVAPHSMQCLPALSRTMAHSQYLSRSSEHWHFRISLRLLGGWGLTVSDWVTLSDP